MANNNPKTSEVRSGLSESAGVWLLQCQAVSGCSVCNSIDCNLHKGSRWLLCVAVYQPSMQARAILKSHNSRDDVVAVRSNQCSDDHVEEGHRDICADWCSLTFACPRIPEKLCHCTTITASGGSCKLGNREEP
jgi:hypothetical protein